MKKFLSTVLTLGFAYNVVYAECDSDFPGYKKARTECVKIFKELTKPENIPATGTFTIGERNDQFVTCWETLVGRYNDYLGDEECSDFTPRKNAKSFDKYFSACVGQNAMGACDELIAKVESSGKNIDAVRGPYGKTLLMAAAEALDENAVLYLLEKGASTSSYDFFGRGALAYALSNRYSEQDENLAANQIKIINALVEQGASPKDIDIYGNSVINKAIQNQAPVAVVQALIDAGAPVSLEIESYNLKDLTGRVVKPAALGPAVVGRNVDLVRMLLKKGAKVNQDLWVALYLYTIRSEAEPNLDERDQITIELLKAGLNPNESVMGSSPVNLALDANASIDVIKAMIEAKLNLKEYAAPLMRFAILNDKEDVVKLLLKNKFDVKSFVGQTVSGADLTALEYAVNAKKAKIVDILVKAKSNVNRNIPTPDGSSFYIVCNAASIEDNFDVLNILLKNKANANAKCSYSGGPLRYAIQNLDEDAVKALIAAKANVNATIGDDGELTLLDFAESQGNQNIINMLKKAGATKPFRGSFVQYCLDANITEKMVLDAIKQGADVNEVDDEGWTPLHSIAQNGKHPAAMSVLIKRGAFVNAMTKRGYTPFLSAARHNPDPAFLKMLIAAGADMDAKDSDGWKALQIAIAYNSPAVVSMLLQTSLAESLSESDKNILIRTAVRNNPDPKVIVALFKAGFKARPENSWLTNPLHTALENNVNFEIIKVLIQGKAEIDDRAMRYARDLPMETSDQKKYRNQVLDFLTKAKKKQK